VKPRHIVILTFVLAMVVAVAVILQVTRRPGTDAAAAAAALRRIAQGSTGFVLLWRNGQELFVALSRE
jgi:hypothetical protein